MDKPLCLLLIHGFGGSEREVEPLATALQAKGYYCRIARLAGHGCGRKAIQNLTWHQWVDSVQVLYTQLAKSHCVVAIGFSMGGLVAVMLNRVRPFAGMVFINTPIYFWNLPQVIKNLATNFHKAARYYFLESAGRVTVYTMLQFLGLLLTAKGQFAHVQCPSLIVQADDDDSVWPQSAHYIYQNVQGNKKLHRVTSGSHQVLLNVEACNDITLQITSYLQLAHTHNFDGSLGSV